MYETDGIESLSRNVKGTNLHLTSRLIAVTNIENREQREQTDKDSDWQGQHTYTETKTVISRDSHIWILRETERQTERHRDTETNTDRKDIERDRQIDKDTHR